ncbi:hypothetical protein [Streptomyces minutiscleroticus]|uniref:Uncharacterized protein n=1 Tax=Streptomyces minutiscleroticus TaxID=68238 RepID=A0A918NGC1_9ACTN|nr:hypothetical protein [Streptomyces minutiscleroticus]GGX65384.1 hypothetical protein GCM10010358_19690 [Streptomyces minutiscleroticus]
MPRPTVIQLVYGSCTVVLSTLAMLLLSGTTSVPAIAVIAVSALILGLLVAWTVPLPKPEAEKAAPAERERVPVPASAREPANP